MSDPSSSFLTIPAEWLPHRALWTAWPSHPDLWEADLEGAREEVAAMILALTPGDTVKVLCNGEEALASAALALGDKATLFDAAFGDIWLRDTGPIIAKAGDGHVAIRFLNNGWGGKYSLPGDDTVGDSLATFANIEIVRQPFILEGGALEHNGDGCILTTRQCLLNPNRNPGWNQSEAEAKLRRALNCRRVLWLETGLRNDHTDGHIDNLARFSARDEIICQSPSGSDDPNAELFGNIEAALQDMGLKVHTIPSPGLVCDEDGEPMPASHMNFIIGNETVVVPTYDTACGAEAVAALQPLFPGRKVVGLPSTHLLTGGGSFHCITQQEPL